MVIHTFYNLHEGLVTILGDAHDAPRIVIRPFSHDDTWEYEQCYNWLKLRRFELIEIALKYKEHSYQEAFDLLFTGLLRCSLIHLDTLGINTSDFRGVISTDGTALEQTQQLYYAVLDGVEAE